MGNAIGDLVWRRRDSGLVARRVHGETDCGSAGDVGAEEEGEHIGVGSGDERVLGPDSAASASAAEPPVAVLTRPT